MLSHSASSDIILTAFVITVSPRFSFMFRARYNADVLASRNIVSPLRISSDARLPILCLRSAFTVSRSLKPSSEPDAPARIAPPYVRTSIPCFSSFKRSPRIVSGVTSNCFARSTTITLLLDAIICSILDLLSTASIIFLLFLP